VYVKDVATASERGSSHAVNEDSVVYLEQPHLVVVADGLGGEGAGDAAARAATGAMQSSGEKLRRVARLLDRDKRSSARLRVGAALERSVLRAHEAVEAMAKARDLSGPMATTMAVAMITNTHAHIAHVGDSRVYLFRDGRLRTLTEDHTLAMLRYKQGRMSLEEYQTSPLRRKLYQVIGAGRDLDVDLAEVELADDDVLVLCTDGVHRFVPPKDMIKALSRKASMAEIAQAIVLRARQKGGDDDASLALLRVASEVRSGQLDAIAAILERLFLFRDLSETERQVIAPYLDKHEYAAGDVLFAEGDMGESFHVVVEGEVKITRASSHLVNVKAGGHFGELCLARPAVRSATVTAVEPTTTFELHRDRFQEVVRRRPAMGARIAICALDYVGDRLRDLTERLHQAES
jgi:PPM family protein phosphatase